tara:strand:+ start:404 stop:697 length:294 start_codon:yes stop_codon:yes gene_type:complete
VPEKQIVATPRVVPAQADDPQAVDPQAVDRADLIDRVVDKGGREARRDQEAHQSVLMALEVVQEAVQVDPEVVRNNNDEVGSKNGADVSKRSFSHKS